MRLLLTTACVAGMALSCNEYIFTPMEPLAISQVTEVVRALGKVRKPKVMFVVDRSGSMHDPVNPSAPACQVGGAPCGSTAAACDTSVCPTRWSEMRSALNAFFTQNATLARFGFLFFPKPGSTACDEPALTSSGGLVAGVPAFDASDSVLQQTATQIRTSVAAANPGGGTPTGATLSLLAEYPELTSADFSEGFVVLVTDGLPNCNDAHPASASVSGSGCICVLQSCAAP